MAFLGSSFFLERGFETVFTGFFSIFLTMGFPAFLLWSLTAAVFAEAGLIIVLITLAAFFAGLTVFFATALIPFFTGLEADLAFASFFLSLFLAIIFYIN